MVPIVHSAPRRRWIGLLRRIIASGLCAALVLDFYLMWRANNPYDPSWQRVSDTKTLLIGLDPTYPPFSAFTTGGASLWGLDVDLGTALAQRLGVKAQFVPLGIDGLYSSLQTAQVDVLISALSIDPTKYGTVWYSVPYVEAGVLLISRADDAYATMEALDGKTVAVEFGSIGDEQARRWIRRLKTLNVQHFLQPDEALQAVQDGKANAALVDGVSVRLYLRVHAGSTLHIADTPVYSDPYCVATRASARALIQRLNAALDAMHKDGSLAEIIGRWL